MPKSESEALHSLDGQHGKGIDGLFENMSFQTAFEGVESGRKSDVKR